MSKTRRHFLTTTAAGLGIAGLAQGAQSGRRISANNKIQVALIGAGGMGSADADSSQATGMAKLVAVADIYDGRRTRAKERWGNDVATTRDYRELLARPDIDAVIIGTPDHWHSRIAIDAMAAGKDVYCEKPMVQKVDDGKPVIEAAKKYNRILQVGSQRVSSIVYQKARDLIAAGTIGQVNMVEAWWDRNSAIGAWQYTLPLDATPENIDWDRFLGRAPKLPFEPIRLFRWRNYQDYGTGVAGDLFVHLFSGMHFVTGAVGPSRVFATGGLRFWNDGRDVPDVLIGLYDYPETPRMPAFNLALRVNFVNGAGETSGFRFVGSEGILKIDQGVTVSRQLRETEPGLSINTFSNATQAEFRKKYREQYPLSKVNADSMRPQTEDVYLPPRGYNEHLEHHRNFLTAVRTRQPVTEDATFGLRAAGPALLSNVSYFENRLIQWDPQTMTVKG